MSTTVEKEWAAIQDEEIVVQRDTEKAVRDELRSRGESPDDYEIVALPKVHGSIWV